MRAELPWNIAGIPPEAREAARAAARREGLSVGEWLTRRILRSFSDMGEDPQPMAFDRMPLDRAPLDPWGLPQSSGSRRDTEDMLARVSRTEAESSDSYRRIEDQLRSVARRLDSAERSQSENNRVISKTASEINIAAREQTQAFDQLGSHVMGLADRLERLERGNAQDGLKDAVKGLHQGLSRLADQITQSASQSATQVSSLAGNLEQLAARLGQVRAESEASAKAMEQRLAAVEKAAQFNTNALDHALEKLEAQAGIRAGDLADLQKRDTASEVTIMRLEENIARLENRGPDPALEKHLDAIDNALNNIVAQMEHNPAAALEDSMRSLARRQDAAEKNHQELLAELRAGLARPAPVQAPSQPSFEPPPSAPAFDAAAFASVAPATYAPPPASLEAPPFAEPAPHAAFGGESGFAPNTFQQVAFPAGFDASDPFAGSFAPDAYAANAYPAAGAEAPPVGAEYAPTPTAENFLSAARRSARAAAETDAPRPGWTAQAKPQGKLLLPILIGLVILAALVAGLVLSGRISGGGHAENPIIVPPKPVTQPAPPQAADSNAPFTPVPQADTSAPAPRVPLGPPSRTVLPLISNPVRNAPVNVVPGSTQAPAPITPQAAAPATSADRVTQLANAGNPTAETILGLNYLDGTGVAADPAQAMKWLQKAADAGQAVAQYRLGTMYERGQGVTADPAKAAKWYGAAASQGNRKAMHNLAVAYADGATGKKDMAEAARWFSKAADLGLVDSQFNLAVLYERGTGVPQSLINAYKWYAIAAAQGDADSKTRLSVLQTQLNDTDRAAAQKSASSFHAAALNRLANVPPEAADLPAN